MPMGGSDHVYTGAIVAQARLSRNCGGTNELQMATQVGPDLRADRLPAGSPGFDGGLRGPPLPDPLWRRAPIRSHCAGHRTAGTCERCLDLHLHALALLG